MADAGRDFIASLSQAKWRTKAAVADAVVDQAKREIIIDRRTGRARQAGTDGTRDEFIETFRANAERSLYFFSKGVMGRDRLTMALHGDACKFLQRIPPYRKLMLMPRDHYKTTLVAQCLPTHILIQPRATNCYFANKDGAESCILLIGETLDRAEKNLRFIQTAFESNVLVRTLWPHRCWDNPRKESKKWNSTEMLIPRAVDFADVSIQAYGVGAATTGAHPNCMIKDDIATEDAANSSTIMQAVKDWHKNSRALLDPPDIGLEFVSGTRWANADVYDDMYADPTMEVYRRAIIEDGNIILPEVYTHEMIDEMRKSYGPMFPLLFMNEPCDPSLVDFNMELVRRFDIIDGAIVFNEDERDVTLHAKLNPGERTPALPDVRGMPLNRFTSEALFENRKQFIRFSR